MSQASIISYCAHNQDEYGKFLHDIQQQFEKKTGEYGKYLFSTKTSDLFQVFLNYLPEEVRQHYTCNSCRRFVNTYGDAVFISETGESVPAMWDMGSIPELYRNSVKACYDIVKKAKVTGCLIRSEKIWGLPVTGEWHHMAVIPSADMLNKSVIMTAGQIAAEKKEDFKTLINALGDFDLSVVNTAVKLLQTESLYRSEKCLGVAEWFRNLHEKRNSTQNSIHRQNITWYAVASAPPGFCHIRSSMIGTLLEDIAAGLPFEVISRRFADKMHPLQYQRPSSLPSAGNVAQAEKIFEKLGIAPALDRRFARFDEIPVIWKSRPEKKQKSGGVFGHLRTKERRSENNLTVPAKKITWVKFRDSILPSATKIEFFPTDTHSPYAAVLTAGNEDAPLIFQWKNPFSWYLYHKGSLPNSWGLSARQWVTVTGICLNPSMWGEKKLLHQGEGVLFLLSGCKDHNYKNAGNALFPETLKSELHSVRKTVEAFSKKAVINGFDNASACGIMLHRNADFGYRFRVIYEGMSVEYLIDRWE